MYPVQYCPVPPATRTDTISTSSPRAASGYEPARRRGSEAIGRGSQRRLQCLVHCEPRLAEFV